MISRHVIFDESFFLFASASYAPSTSSFDFLLGDDMDIAVLLIMQLVALLQLLRLQWMSSNRVQILVGLASCPLPELRRLLVRVEVHRC
jgi:hypothetical protein